MRVFCFVSKCRNATERQKKQKRHLRHTDKTVSVPFFYYLSRNVNSKPHTANYFCIPSNVNRKA